MESESGGASSSKEAWKELVRRTHVSHAVRNKMPDDYYHRLQRRVCMACGRGDIDPDQGLVLINHTGIVELYCSAPCMQDLHVIGFLQELIDDHIQKIKFRGGRGDAVEEEEEDDDSRED